MNFNKISFLILGVQKGGTTWLYKNLSTHPQIYCPPQELSFFSSDKNFERGEGYYHSLFSEATYQKIIGEKTPEYFNVISPDNPQTSELTHQRIFEYNPDMKLIIVLREPVARLKSAVGHLLRTRRMNPFDSVEDVIFGDKSNIGREFSLIETGFYYENIMRYLDLFSRDQLMILFFEKDILEDSISSLTRICVFLGLDFSENYFPDLNVRHNEYRMSKPALVLNHWFPQLRPVNNRLNHIFKPYRINFPKDIIYRLQEIYGPHNENLKKLTGGLPDSWNY